MDTKLTLPPKTTPDNKKRLSLVVSWADIDNLVYYTLDTLGLPQDDRGYVRISSFTNGPAWMAYPTRVCRILKEIHCVVNRTEFVEILHQGLDENGELTLTIDNEFHLQLEVGMATWCITCA